MNWLNIIRAFLPSYLRSTQRLLDFLLWCLTPVMQLNVAFISWNNRYLLLAKLEPTIEGIAYYINNVLGVFAYVSAPNSFSEVDHAYLAKTARQFTGSFLAQTIDLQDQCYLLSTTTPPTPTAQLDIQLNDLQEQTFIAAQLARVLPPFTSISFSHAS